jgi:hypothetical protein
MTSIIQIIKKIASYNFFPYKYKISLQILRSYFKYILKILAI